MNERGHDANGSDDEGSDAFFAVDVECVLHKYRRWHECFPRVKPFYGKDDLGTHMRREIYGNRAQRRECDPFLHDAGDDGGFTCGLLIYSRIRARCFPDRPKPGS